MESATFKILFDNYLNLSEVSHENSVQTSIALLQRIKRRKSVLLMQQNKLQRRKVPKTVDVWKVISKMPDDVFSSHFRMKMSTFQVIF